MFRQNIILLWFEWCFFDVPKEILKAWQNFLRFNLNYFSIPILLKTFFSPWRKYKLSYGKQINLWKYFEVFVSNMMSRIIGAFLRFFLILTGILVEIFIFFIGLIIFLFWFILPLFLIAGLIFGFKLLI